MWKEKPGVLGKEYSKQRPCGSRACHFERATRRPVWLEKGAKVGECTAGLCEL